MLQMAASVSIFPSLRAAVSLLIRPTLLVKAGLSANRFPLKKEKEKPNPVCPTTMLNLEQFPGACLCVHFIGCVFYSAGPM